MRAPGGCDNRRCNNKKTQIGNGTRDMNDVMPGIDGLGFLVILNKSSELRFGLRRSGLIFRTWVRPASLWTAGCARTLFESVS